MPRVWWQRSITPFINPLLLTLGLYANYTAHLIETFAGHESWRPTKLLLPLQARTAPQPTPPQRCTPSATLCARFCPPSHTLHSPSTHPPPLLPPQIGLMLQAWGWRGALLVYIAHSVLGIYYFSLALMNHNGAPTSPSHIALVPSPPPPPPPPPPPTQTPPLPS